MKLQQSRTRSNVDRVMMTSLCLTLLTLAGCGVDDYRKAVADSDPELKLRSKFASLGGEYQRFPIETDARGKKLEYPIAFRIPRMFLTDDTAPQPRWKAFDGKAVKLNSKDPFFTKTDETSVIPIPKDYAIPPELVDPLLNPAHQGTFIAEYKVTIEDPPGSGSKNTFQQNLMLSIWVFDTANKSRPIPSDTFMLQLVKRAGREPVALTSINAAQKKAEKAAFKASGWEEDEIPTAPIPEKLKGSITAKLARIFVKSKFLSAVDEPDRRPKEKDGIIRLWSFRLGDKDRYQVFVMLRVPYDLTAGDDAPFPLDAENPESDKLSDLGRAVIGSMVVVPESAPAEAEAKKN